MRKEWEFKVKDYDIRIVNTWLSGAKLYVDGDLRDSDTSFFANGKTILLSTKLDENNILEIVPLSALFSVEMDAFLLHGKNKEHVFSSLK
jgi:hypothetical protein